MVRGVAAGQRDLLETAIDSGYSSTPRSTTLAELGVSHQPISEQLRRPQQKLATERVRKRSDQQVNEEA